MLLAGRVPGGPRTRRPWLSGRVEDHRQLRQLAQRAQDTAAAGPPDRRAPAARPGSTSARLLPTPDRLPHHQLSASAGFRVGSSSREGGIEESPELRDTRCCCKPGQPRPQLLFGPYQLGDLRVLAAIRSACPHTSAIRSSRNKLLRLGHPKIHPHPTDRRSPARSHGPRPSSPSARRPNATRRYVTRQRHPPATLEHTR